jgi:hypothetical protein
VFAASVLGVLGFIGTLWVVCDAWTYKRVFPLYVAIGLWAVLPPLWFWLEYFYLYRVYGQPDTFELFKYGQEIAKPIWAGVFAALIAFAASDATKPAAQKAEAEIAHPIPAPQQGIGSATSHATAPKGNKPDGHNVAVQNPLPKQVPFPDFGYLPPPEQYKGPLFTLSQDYPLTRVQAKEPDFLSIPFNENDKEQNWLKYLLAVRNYCFEGNNDVDWDVRKNPVRKWYHAPWQHWGRNGREGIRGLTREATAQPGQLASTQSDKFQTYAVAFYNDVGGFTIGQVWRDHLEPNYRSIHFDVGTVVFKLLFTQASIDQVPFLNPPVEWTAYVEASDKDQTRSVQKLRLLQMDIMVRDERALRINGTGWVFGTYCYNGKVGSKNPYENLVPVGLQWGDDPDLSDDVDNPKPVKTIVNRNLKETVINSSADLPPQHLGWNSRLNGPADYYASSCMSCHSTAQYPVLRYQNPDFGKRKVKHGPGEWMRWFRNLKCGEPFSENSNSTDFSLQLALGIQNFHHWRDQQGGFSARKIELTIEVKRGKE